MEVLNPRSDPVATAQCVVRQERALCSVWWYGRPTAVLVVGLAATLYGFGAVRGLERQYPAAGIAGERESGGKAHAVLLGGCALTLFSAFCSVFRVGRVPGRPHPPSRAGRGLPDLEETLRASNDTLSQILDGTSIPLFVIDRAHVVTRWNQACRNLTGVPARDMVGTRRAWTAFYPTERPVMAELVVDQRPKADIVALYGSQCRESPALPGAYEFEAPFSNLGENGKWLFFTAAPLRDADGRVVGAIETFQDITDRKRAEEELQRRIEEVSEAKRRLEVMVASMTDREKRMVDLKTEVNDLLQALGRELRYAVPQQVAQLRAPSRLSAVE
jgi:PAS domain-containing protein